MSFTLAQFKHSGPQEVLRRAARSGVVGRREAGGHGLQPAPGGHRGGEHAAGQVRGGRRRKLPAVPEAAGSLVC